MEESGFARRAFPASGRVRRNERITGADGQQALARQDIAQPGGVAVAPVVDHVVHGDRLGEAHMHADLQMVLQIGADAGHVGDHLDAEVAQKFAGPRA